MDATLVMDQNPGTWERALEGLVRINEEQLRGFSGIGQHLPPLYQSGVVYREEPAGQEKWMPLRAVYRKGSGDCEDLAAIRCAELHVTGEDIDCHVTIVRTGPKRWHAVVKRSDGNIEDPTRILKFLEKQRNAGDRNENEPAENGEQMNEDNILGQFDNSWMWQQGANDPYAALWAQAGFDSYGQPGQQWGAGYDPYGQYGQYGQMSPYSGYADPYGGYGGMYGYDPFSAGYGGQGYGYPVGYDQMAYMQAYQPYGYDPYAGQYATAFGQLPGYGYQQGMTAPYGMDPYAMQMMLEQQQNQQRLQRKAEIQRRRSEREKQAALREQRQAFRAQMKEQRQAQRQLQRERAQAAREQGRARQERLQAEREARRVAQAQREEERRAARPRGWHLPGLSGWPF